MYRIKFNGVTYTANADLIQDAGLIIADKLTRTGWERPLVTALVLMIVSYLGTYDFKTCTVDYNASDFSFNFSHNIEDEFL